MRQDLRCPALVGAAMVLLALLTGCAGGSTASPSPSAAPPSVAVPQAPGDGRITPTSTELEIDTSTSNDGPTLPWSLVKVDRDLNRIYLTASSSGCVTPTSVRIEETSTSVTLTVIGVGGTGPCTLEKRTMTGYVTTQSPLGTRTVQGNSSDSP